MQVQHGAGELELDPSLYLVIPPWEGGGGGAEVEVGVLDVEEDMGGGGVNWAGCVGVHNSFKIKTDVLIKKRVLS